MHIHTEGKEADALIPVDLDRALGSALYKWM